MLQRAAAAVEAVPLLPPPSPALASLPDSAAGHLGVSCDGWSMLPTIGCNQQTFGIPYVPKERVLPQIGTDGGSDAKSLKWDSRCQHVNYYYAGRRVHGTCCC